MELDNAIATPLYKQLEELILDKITSGTLTPGSKLPTENELSEQYHVSRVTVRKAFAALDSQGYLEKKSGKGTFIAEKKMQRSLYVRLRKEWTILPQAIPDYFPKLWLISGAAAVDELSGLYHFHRRTRYYACCGLHRIYPQKS